MSTIDERYFAIRVGDPRRHKCYLWVGEDGSVPRLWLSREEPDVIVADGFDGTPAKVVRVRIKTG